MAGSRLLSSPSDEWAAWFRHHRLDPWITATSCLSFPLAPWPCPAVPVPTWKLEHFSPCLAVQRLPTTVRIRVELPSVANEAPPKPYSIPSFSALRPPVVFHVLVCPVFPAVCPGVPWLHRFFAMCCCPFSEDLPSPPLGGLCFLLHTTFTAKGRNLMCLSLPFCFYPPPPLEYKFPDGWSSVNICWKK